MTDATTNGTKCAFCLAAVGAEEASHSCPTCHAIYHHDCWEENGGCAVYGCAQTPAVESRRGIEVPVSYWGQENKPCPSCGQQILAAAMRCRHCGVTFTSARPQDTTEFKTRTALEGRLPAARRQVITIFVFSVVPILAPVGAVWGVIWRHGHRDEIAALPPLYAALHKVGLIAALALTIALVVMTALYVTMRGV